MKFIIPGILLVACVYSKPSLAQSASLVSEKAVTPSNRIDPKAFDAFVTSLKTDLQQSSSPNSKTGILNSSSPVKKGSEGVGGGDDIGLEFRARAEAVVSALAEADAATFAKLKFKVPNLRDLKVIATNDELVVLSGTSQQISVATNDPTAMLIRVNRLRWNMIQSNIVKTGIVLHEILSLAGIEATGAYQISGQFVMKGGFESQTDEGSTFVGSDPRFTFDDAKAAFNTFTAPAEADVLQQDWLRLGLASSKNDSTYSPDGVFVDDGHSYKVISKFERATGAFGSNKLLRTLSAIDVSSNELLERESLPFAIDQRGLVITSAHFDDCDRARKHGGECTVRCEVQTECRTDGQSKLLCALKYTDRSSLCSDKPIGKVFNYSLYIK